MIAQGLPALGGALVGAITGPPITTYTLTPDATLANSGWTPVSAASVHAALASGDSDYITADTDGATATVSLNAPASPLTITAASLTFRHRIRPSA